MRVVARARQDHMALSDRRIQERHAMRRSLSDLYGERREVLSGWTEMRLKLSM